MSVAANYNLWTVAGLIFCLAGAGLLLSNAFSTPLPGQSSNSNDDLHHQTARWLDARVGAALLLVGFFLQATGAVGGEKLHSAAIFVLLGLALGMAYYAFSKDLIVHSLLDQSSEGSALARAAEEHRAAKAAAKSNATTHAPTPVHLKPPAPEPRQIAPDTNPTIAELEQNESAA